jgi:hypothetical protein
VRRLLAFLAAPVAAVAQERPPGAPLDPVANLPIPVIAAPSLPRLLEPLYSVGLFHTLGLAAGLPDDIERSRGRVRAGWGHEGGLFRRPFDPDGATERGAEGSGWGRLSAGSAVWGRAAVQDAVFDHAGYASFMDPYGSSPLVMADTTSPRSRRSRALIEGAMGWRLGGLRLGLAGGLDVREDATRDARFIRSVRHSVPAVQASVGYALPAGLVVALYGRWMGGSETAIFRPEPGGSRAYQFDGFDDPFPRDIAPPNAYFRRNQRDGYAAGAGITGPLTGGRWVVGWARTYRTDRHFTLLVEDPPSDTWEADGWTGRAAYQRRVLGVVSTLTLHADRLTGDVRRVDIDGVITRARDTRMGAGLELRWAPANSLWEAGLTLGLDRTRRQVSDFLVRVDSDLDFWTPSGAVGVARTVGSTTIAAAVGVAAPGAYATLPSPPAMGPVYQWFIAPGLSRDATRSLTASGSLAVRHRVTERLAFEAFGWWNRTTIRGAPAEFGPDGRYNQWEVGAAVVLGRG